MKKIFILFITLLLYPQQGFSKAMCPVDISLEDCCALKDEQTLSACQASCSGTCEEGYYASCYTCSSGSGSLNLCYPTLAKCNKAITLPDVQYCEKFGNNYCIFLNKDPEEPTTPTTTTTVSSCPSEGSLSSDKCCCEYN